MLEFTGDNFKKQRQPYLGASAFDSLGGRYLSSPLAQALAAPASPLVQQDAAQPDMPSPPEQQPVDAPTWRPPMGPASGGPRNTRPLTEQQTQQATWTALDARNKGPSADEMLGLQDKMSRAGVSTDSKLWQALSSPGMTKDARDALLGSIEGRVFASQQVGGLAGK